MKDLEALFPRIAPRVKGASDPIIRSAIRTAAMEFCERTRLWRSADTFSISEASCNVMAVPYGAVLYEIESARFNGQALEPASLSWLEDNVYQWRDKTGSAGTWITQLAPDTVRMVPAASGKLDLLLILKPSDDTDHLPDFIVQSHGPVIADGALAELMTVPEQPFYNPDLASFHSSRFRQNLDRLFNSSMKGQQRAPIRTVPQFF